MSDGPRVDPKRNPHELAPVVAGVAAREGWQRAAAVIELHWDAFASEAPSHLLEALKALPGEAFVETPGLLVAANYLRHVTVGGDPRRFFNDGRLIPPLRQSDGVDLNNLILLTGQAAGARTSGRLAEARQVAEEARAALLSMDEADRAAIAGSLPHLRFQWGRSLDAADAPGALAEYEEAYDLARLTGQPAIARRAAGHIAWLHAERGRLRLAELWLARAHAEPATNGRYDVVVYLASALLKHDRQDATASQDLARALGLPLGEQWAMALWLSAMLEHTKPGAASVHAQLESELERHPEADALEGANGRYITAAKARLARLRPRLRVDSPMPAEPSALDHLLAAANAYRIEQYGDALASSEAAAASTAAPRVEAPAQLIAAASHFALGHSGTASDAFRQANAIIGTERLLSAYAFVPRSTLSALADLTGEPVHGQGHGHGRADADTPGLPRLSEREQDILDLLATGLSLPQIAAELFISPNTLKTQVRTLYRKLDVGSRAAAVDLAKRANSRFPGSRDR